ncbi:MAG: hypothetical protein LC772_08395 [Chloroflexi bacterium]|nr:hypothetical protein [Chloroflexota bacterium]
MHSFAADIDVKKVDELLLASDPPLKHIRFVVGEQRVSYWVPIGPAEGCRTEEQAENVARQLYVRDGSPAQP